MLNKETQRDLCISLERERVWSKYTTSLLEYRRVSRERHPPPTRLFFYAILFFLRMSYVDPPSKYDAPRPAICLGSVEHGGSVINITAEIYSDFRKTRHALRRILEIFGRGAIAPDAYLDTKDLLSDECKRSSMVALLNRLHEVDFLALFTWHNKVRLPREIRFLGADHHSDSHKEESLALKAKFEAKLADESSAEDSKAMPGAKGKAKAGPASKTNSETSSTLSSNTKALVSSGLELGTKSEWSLSSSGYKGPVTRSKSTKSPTQKSPISPPWETVSKVTKRRSKRIEDKQEAWSAVQEGFKGVSDPTAHFTVQALHSKNEEIMMSRRHLSVEVCNQVYVRASAVGNTRIRDLADIFRQSNESFPYRMRDVLIMNDKSHTNQDRWQRCKDLARKFATQKNSRYRVGTFEISSPKATKSKS